MSATGRDQPSPWWALHRHRDRRPFLLARNRIKAAVRAWFESRGFVEIDPSCLQVSPGNETHLHGFETRLVGTDLSVRPLYLQTSPEFALKKLVAAGEPAIFAFAPSFRNRERGALHAPEFTMLEWYRTDAPYEQLWSDCASIMQVAARASGRTTCQWGSVGCDVDRACETISVEDAFRRYAGIELGASISDAGVDRGRLGAQASGAGIRIADDDTWSDIFSRVLVERIEPHLGRGAATILHAYPAHESALARRMPDKSQFAERFELFAAGVELANGFGELTDATEQRLRLDQQMAEKQRIYGERYPLDEDLLAALPHMPPTAGCAMGFDRLVMLATGAGHIDQVQWTPLAEDPG